MNILNLDNPILEQEKQCMLKNGTKITVKGVTFDHSLMPTGDPVHTLVTLTDEKEVSAGIIFFLLQMGEQELKDKVDEICENADQYLSPGYKQQINN